MKITHVRYGRTINTGNYENERIEFEAEVQDGETPDGVLTRLRALVGGEPPEALSNSSQAAHIASHGGQVVTQPYALVCPSGAVYAEFERASDYMAAFMADVEENPKQSELYHQANFQYLEKAKQAAYASGIPEAKQHIDSALARLDAIMDAYGGGGPYG